jgi:hypothetical protein
MGMGTRRFPASFNFSPSRACRDDLRHQQQKLTTPAAECGGEMRCCLKSAEGGRPHYSSASSLLFLLPLHPNQLIRRLSTAACEKQIVTVVPANQKFSALKRSEADYSNPKEDIRSIP